MVSLETLFAVIVIVLCIEPLQVEAGGGGGRCGSWGGRSYCGGNSWGRKRHHISRHFSNCALGSAGFDIWFAPVQGSIALRRQERGRAKRRSRRSSGNNNDGGDGKQGIEAPASGVSTFSVTEDPETGLIDLELEVPGVLRDSIAVEVEDNKLLRVTGRRTKLSSKRSEDYEFNQTFKVDEDLDSDDMNVTLSAGVLRIQASRRKKTIRKIPVEVTEENQLAVLNNNYDDNDRRSQDQTATKAILDRLRGESIKM